ncbi:MAG: glycosyl transferase family 1, partial [Chloroflexi bacterium]|nr:glycosyl transferase family 1 [Chloroflexota bacterium]
MINIEEYSKHANGETIEEIKLLAKDLKGIKVLHINSTKKGGGVAEILSRLVPIMNSLGIETKWETIGGSEDFFKFTKKLHNLLHIQSASCTVDSKEIALYIKTIYENVSKIDTKGYDLIFIHDPQPLGMIVKKEKGQKWIWRCHIDTSTPDPRAWN